MNIVCATDDNFVQHCSIMLTSLLCNNQDVDIYILTEGLKSENESIIREEVERYNGIVHFTIVDKSIVEKFPMPNLGGLQHISRATYYRLLIPELLPVDIHKVLYLDCDIIVNGSLTELWNIDVQDYALAAVPQIGYGFEAIRLGYPIEYGYFNAGVNVINVDYWRSHNVVGKLLNYIENNYTLIKYHDQDALNAVLYDQTYHLLPQWNMTSIVYVKELKKMGDSVNGTPINRYEREKANAKTHLKNPIVLHFVSKPKPWQKNCVHPLVGLYYKYAKCTIHYKDIQQQTFYSLILAIIKHNIVTFGSAIKQRIKKTDPKRL